MQLRLSIYVPRVLPTLTSKLLQKQSLSDEQVREAVGQLSDENISPETKAEFLSALSSKGETVEEIAAFARELRDKSIRPPIPPEIRGQQILDVCGTGGDHLGTFNISTTVAIIVAAAGVMVAKHGNRAVTSQSGSADVLEALGIKIDVTPEEAARHLAEQNFAFFFAPKYHPAFKHIAPARKLCAERGQRTIFNLLGPLLNPARPNVQLIGVAKKELCEPIARVLQLLGIRRGMAVCGEIPTEAGTRGLDEFSTLGENHIAEFYQDRGFAVSVMSPIHFPIQSASLSDLLGGNRDVNAEIIRRILRGEERGPKRDAVLLNSAAALFVANKVKSLAEGWSLAAEIIDCGKAKQKLRDLQNAS